MQSTNNKKSIRRSILKAWYKLTGTYKESSMVNVATVTITDIHKNEHTLFFGPTVDYWFEGTWFESGENRARSFINYGTYPIRVNETDYVKRENVLSYKVSASDDFEIEGKATENRCPISTATTATVVLICIASLLTVFLSDSSLAKEAIGGRFVLCGLVGFACYVAVCVGYFFLRRGIDIQEILEEVFSEQV